MTYYVSSGTLNPTHSLTPTHLGTNKNRLEFEVKGWVWVVSGPDMVKSDVLVDLCPSRSVV